MPFLYEVPSNTGPGDYAGGIVAEETRGTESGKGSVRVHVLQAVGSAVYGRVAGPLEPRLAVTQVSVSIVNTSVATQFGGAVDARVVYSVTNTGNENLKPKVEVSLSPLIGSGPAARTVQLPQILTGSTVMFAQTFKDVVPFGDLTANVTATAKGASATGSGSAIVIPWALLLIVIVLIALIVFLVYRRRRRRRSVTPKDGGPREGRPPSPRPVRDDEEVRLLARRAHRPGDGRCIERAGRSGGRAAGGISEFTQFRRWSDDYHPGLGMEAGHQAPGPRCVEETPSTV